MLKRPEILKKCTHPGCKRLAYAYGLCHEHYLESIGEEEKTQHKLSSALSVAVSVVISVVFVLVFVAAAAAAVEFVISCCRYGGNGRMILYILSVMAVLAVMLAVMAGLLKIADNYAVIKIILLLVLAAGVVLAVLYYDVVFDFAAETVKTATKAFCDLIAEKL